MFKSDQLNQLINIARKSSEQINKEISIFDESLKEVLKNVPEEQKAEVEKLMSATTKAINYAKMGKAEQANEVIQNFQNGRKSSKQTV